MLGKVTELDVGLSDKQSKVRGGWNHGVNVVGTAKHPTAHGNLANTGLHKFKLGLTGSA